MSLRVGGWVGWRWKGGRRCDVAGGHWRDEMFFARLWTLLPVVCLVTYRGGFEVSLEEQVGWWSSGSLSESK